MGMSQLSINENASKMYNEKYLRTVRGQQTVAAVKYVIEIGRNALRLVRRKRQRLGDPAQLEEGHADTFVLRANAPCVRNWTCDMGDAVVKASFGLGSKAVRAVLDIV